MNERIEALTARLHEDPYRVDLLIERLLLCAAESELTAAQADLATVQRLGAARTFIAPLVQVAAGRLRVREESGAYLIFDSSLEPTFISWTIHFLYAARNAADQFFGPTDCLIVAELSQSVAGIHHASIEVPGIGYVKLSPRSSLIEHEAVLAHEVAHVYLTSGNRFLDEGIAVLFQARCTKGRIFVGTEFESSAVLEQQRDHVLPLRALLAHDARSDVFFDRLVPNARRRQAVYAASHTLAAHLLERLQLPGLKALCARLRECAMPAAHPAVVAEFLGTPIEALDQLLFGRPAGASVNSCGTVAVHEHVPSSALIWSAIPPARLRSLIGQMRATLARDPADTATRAALARALIRRVLDDGSHVPQADVAEARSLTHELNAEGRYPIRDRLLLEGWLAIAQTHTASSVAVRIVNWERAVETFRDALARFPQDPEVLCASATLHLRGPEQYGASRALARTCLDCARRIRGWAPLADAIEKIHGTVPADQA